MGGAGRVGGGAGRRRAGRRDRVRPGPGPAPSPTGWGFNKIAELPRDTDSKAVYAKLANLSDEWNKMPTDDRLALAKRLSG